MSEVIRDFKGSLRWNKIVLVVSTSKTIRPTITACKLNYVTFLSDGISSHSLIEFLFIKCYLSKKLIYHNYILTSIRFSQ